ncbi:hypothetical protein [Celeribacter sp.]|uniref:hypothetical protein n=1 Tax=Celeribacter sp. TaxID=1890673 RepID=UPI003A9024F7
MADPTQIPLDRLDPEQAESGDPDVPRPDLSRVERRTPLYLARASYRQRRWIDAQRLLPFLLFSLYLLPLLWGGDNTGEPVGRGVRAVVFVFVIWGVAIMGSVAFAIAMQRKVAQEPRLDGERSPTDDSTIPQDGEG